MRHAVAQLQDTQDVTAACETRFTDSRTLHILLLSAVALFTRIPLIGAFEPDSALFLIGVREWIQGGPHSLWIYSARMCSLYYFTITALIRSFNLSQANYTRLLGGISVAAGLGILVLGYLLGRRVVKPLVSFSAMMLFAFSPGLWWITIEPHPQAISLFFGLLAVFLLVRFIETQFWAYVVCSAISFGIALGMKNSALLIAPAMFAMAAWVRPRWSSLASALAVAVSGGLECLLLQRLIVGSPATSAASGQSGVSYFYVIPNFTRALKQITPDLFGLGIVVALVFAFTIPKFLLKNPGRYRLLLLLAVWSVPGYLFWYFLEGNNTRHVVAFELPIFWLGASALRPKWVWASLVLSTFVPANSDMTMFPSPNVLSSTRETHAKEDYLARLAADLSAADSCFLGSYSDDYVTNSLMAKGAIIRDVRTGGNLTLVMPSKTTVLIRRTDPWLGKKVNLDSCRSVEYNRSGQKQRFLGDEWHVPRL